MSTLCMCPQSPPLLLAYFLQQAQKLVPWSHPQLKPSNQHHPCGCVPGGDSALGQETLSKLCVTLLKCVEM